ncbi:LysE/ArgO family amino acid transporter [Luethyella okanaganae]|uniref:LysE family transporter n=1 Tax=Luethyella okanaganae TaxID=69372 RepID=A0ABW1V9G7_9MICO
MSTLATAALAGLGLGFSLIVAIGAQNVFVLRQGLRREHLLSVVLICAVSDIVLVAVGIGGIGAVLERAPVLPVIVRWVGAAFLVGYGILAARRSLHPGALIVDEGSDGDSEPVRFGGRPPSGGPLTSNPAVVDPGGTTVRARPAAAAGTSLRATVLTCIALTWLNPHVYLDTVFLLGSIANSHGETGRWAFGAGAALASVVWFGALGFGARLLGRWLGTPTAWRVFDGVIAVVMVVMGVLLVRP